MDKVVKFLVEDLQLTIHASISGPYLKSVSEPLTLSGSVEHSVPYKLHGTRTGRYTDCGDSIIYQPTTEDLMTLTQGVIDRIEKVGWIQGHYTNDSGSCVMGHAIAITNIEQPYAYPYLEFSPRRIIIDKWEKDFGKFIGYINVVQFNDDLKTTKEIVLEKLRDYMYELKGR